MDELKPVIVNGEGRNDSPTTGNLSAENEPKRKRSSQSFLAIFKLKIQRTWRHRKVKFV